MKTKLRDLHDSPSNVNTEFRVDHVYCGPGEGCGIRLVRLPIGLSASQPPPIRDAKSITNALLEELQRTLADKIDPR